MNVRWLTTRAAFLLLALAIYPGNIPPQHKNVDVPDAISPLRFDQSVALTDFDADGLIDEAKLNAFGRHKRVRIFLSGTQRQSLIHFESKGFGHGSLLTQDVDNDGVADLIWTDLLRSENVIIWLGDGGGNYSDLPVPDIAEPLRWGTQTSARPRTPTRKSLSALRLIRRLSTHLFSGLPIEPQRRFRIRIQLASPVRAPQWINRLIEGHPHISPDTSLPDLFAAIVD